MNIVYRRKIKNRRKKEKKKKKKEPHVESLYKKSKTQRTGRVASSLKCGIETASFVAPRI